jgi:hypothetical protein
VVELPDRTRVSLPLSWAALVDAEAPGTAKPEGTSEDPWVDVTSLLNLARMIKYIAENQPEEVECHGTFRGLGELDEEVLYSDRALNITSQVGESVVGASARVGHHAGGDADQAAPQLPPHVGGGGS